MFCPGISALPDGRILVNGGNDSAKTSIYNPATDAWTTGPPMTIPRGYQASTTLSDGRVFTIGGSWSGGGRGGKHGKIGEVWSAATGWTALPGAPAAPMLTADPATASTATTTTPGCSPGGRHGAAGRPEQGDELVHAPPAPAAHAGRQPGRRRATR